MRDTRSIQNQALWRVLLLLLVVVVVPTVCVLWFMTEAMRNQRLAVRQELTTLYRSQLVGLGQELRTFWERKQLTLASMDPDTPAAELFAELVRSGVADSAIVYDPSGRVLYPPSPEPRTIDQTAGSRGWLAAQELEFKELDYAAAARAYGRIAAEVTDPNIAGRAFQAQARCLGKAGRVEAAVKILTETLTQPTFRRATDLQGRLIAPSAQLMALHLMDDPALETYGRTADRLRAQLSDYSDPALTATQRRFLMKQFGALMPEAPAFATLEALDLAFRYLESDPPPRRGGSLGSSELPGVWCLASQDGRLVAMFREQTMKVQARSLMANLALPDDAAVELLPPGTATQAPPFASVSFEGTLPGWRLTLHLPDQRLLDSAADEQIAAYLWTGFLVIGIIVVVAVVIARSVGRQMKLTQLKNNLIATVSHELKTPLASMRLLVDTLLEGHTHDEPRVREYLELISKENARLSRLIEHFLAFSRMERNKQTFERAEIQAQDIATAAAEAVDERFHAAHCRFDVEIEPNMPKIVGDADVLVTVVLNLLDNAYKYTEGDKHIVLRAYSENAHVCFEVQDNGIGLSHKAARRVFQRFYQVDQSLSRGGGGVGLGLSIVQFIVNAHGGSVSVASQAGEGSTFTVKLPVLGTENG